MSPQPYYADERVSLYLGDCREILPALGLTFAAAIADPSYEETTLRWDRWADGWLDTLATVTRTLWCFGSLGMFMDHAAEFPAAGWRRSQDVIGEEVDVIWEKHNGSGFQNDRFKRVHEQAALFYRGRWQDQRQQVPRVEGGESRRNKSAKRVLQPAHTGKIAQSRDPWRYDGTHLMRSVIKVRSTQGHAIHPTQKPLGILTPLIEYSTAPGDLLVDPFAGSASTLVAARMAGRGAIGIEGDERYAEEAAKRLSQGVLDIEAA